MEYVLETYKEILGVIINFVLYVFLVSQVYPRLFLRAGWSKDDIKDRGIKKYSFSGGRAILYEPSLSCRKYIKQYILSVHDRKKYLKCSIDERITSIRYEAVVFDANDRFVKIIEVSEPIRSEGDSSAVQLPPETAFVSLNVREINGISVDTGKTLSLQFYKVMYFGLLTVITSVLEGLYLFKQVVIRYSLYSYPIDEESIFSIAMMFYGVSRLTILIAMMAGALISWFIVSIHLSESVKIKLK